VKALSGVLAVLAVLAVGTKLFTYEFYLADDPTSGVALRASPSLESRAQLGGPSGSVRDRILVEDENRFPGCGIYRALVQIGWLALPGLAMAALIASHRRPSGRVDE
jgi:hypothetical protein